MDTTGSPGLTEKKGSRRFELQVARRLLSYQGVIDLIGELQPGKSEAGHQDTGFNECTHVSDPCVVVHQELLEAASIVFRNALKSGSWSEGAEKRIRLPLDQTSLEVFAAWLYGSNIDPCRDWMVWIDLFIFAPRYFLDHLAHDILILIDKKAGDMPWHPTIEEIQKVYEGTNEGCILRSKVVESFAVNLKEIGETAQNVLREAPDAFVRDYAIEVSQRAIGSPGASFFQHHFYLSDRPTVFRAVGFRHVVQFDLSDCEKPGVIHAGMLCDTKGSAGLFGKSGKVCGSSVLSKRDFEIFASWLYFELDLSSPTDKYRNLMDVPRFLDLYGASEVLIGYTLDCPNLHVALKKQATRFKNCVLDAMIMHYQRHKTVPSASEIRQMYTVTTLGDPLRQLFGDMFILNGHLAIDSIDHAEFHRDLNRSLIIQYQGLKAQYCSMNAIVTESREAMEKPKSYQQLRGRRYMERPSFLEERMLELLNEGPVDHLVSIEPSKYHS